MSGSTKEDWANIRRQWFRSVHEIADIELQRRTWLAPPTPSPHWSYVEFCCCFPDAKLLKHALDQEHLSEKEFALFMTLGRAIDEHVPPKGNDYDHAAILADPTWQAVVAKAEKIRSELLPLIKDAVERSDLIGDQSDL